MRTHAPVLNAYLDDHDCTVVLVSRDAQGKRRERRLPAEWATYFKAADIEPGLERAIRTSVHTASVRREGEWLRVGWKNKWAREDICFNPRSPIVMAGVASYEADVDAVRRLMTDAGDTIEIGKPRRCYLDIETDSRVSFAEKDRMRVLCWSVVDEDDNTFADVLTADDDRSERELLQRLWAVLEDYDQVVAWNGDEFDFPVIFSRSEQRGIDVNARRWLWVDHLTLFERMNKHSAESGEEKRSMKLEDIANAVVGEGKEVVPDWVRERFGDKKLGALAWQLWEAGGEFRRLLVRYCVRDTVLLKKIEAKNGYIALFGTVCEVCSLFGDSPSLNPTRQMDGFMLKLGRARGHHFASKRYREATEQFKGAFVMEPKCQGIERSVHVCDFSGLYPNIILTFNMSPDTKRSAPVNGPIAPGCCRAPTTGITFATGEHGILTLALREMIRLRKAWNDKKASLPPATPEWFDADRRSTAYKVVANSFYGVVGSPFSRYFDRHVAESVTQTGAWLLKHVIAAAEARGWKAIYGDTDSVFVQGCSKDEFAAFTQWCNTDLFPPLLEAQGCVENHIKLAYEKEFDILVMTSAKRYIGRFAHYKGKAASADSKPEIKGIEYKRGDSALLAFRLQEKVIDLLCGGMKANPSVQVPTQDLAHYHEVLSRARTHVLEDPLPITEVMMSKGLSKALREYVAKKKTNGEDASQPPHVMVAKILQQRGQAVGRGTRIEYIVADGSTSPAKVIPAEDYTGAEADRYYLWENLVFPPTQRLLEAAFPQHDWKSWGRVRPPKPRGRKPKVLPGQEALPLMAEGGISKTP